MAAACRTDGHVVYSHQNLDGVHSSTLRTRSSSLASSGLLRINRIITFIDIQNVYGYIPISKNSISVGSIWILLFSLWIRELLFSLWTWELHAVTETRIHEGEGAICSLISVLPEIYIQMCTMNNQTLNGFVYTLLLNVKWETLPAEQLLWAGNRLIKKVIQMVHILKFTTSKWRFD